MKNNEYRTDDFTGRANEEDVTISDIFYKLLVGKWYLLIGYAVVLAFFSFSTYRQAPVYQASSMILINDETGTPQLGELLGIQTTNRNVSNEVEILKSRTIAMRVADALLRWQDIPGSASSLTVLGDSEPGKPASTQHEISSRLKGGYVSMKPLSREVDLIEITAQSTVPREAALIADMYADEYQAYNKQQRRRRVSAGVEFLQNQVARFDTLLVDAESSILSYTESAGVVDPQVEASALLDQVMALEAERYKADFQIRAAQSEYQTLEAELNKITPGLAQTLNSNNDEAILALRARITQLQLDNAEKLAKTPALMDDPGMDNSGEYAANLRLIEDFQDELQERAATVVNNMFESGSIVLGNDSGRALTRIADMQESIITKRLEMTGAQARLDVLDGQLEVYRAQIDQLPNKAVLLSRYQRDMDTSAQLYTSIFQSLQEARIAQESELGYVDIIDRAVVPASPISPSIQRNLMLAVILGLALGGLGAVLRSAFDNQVSDPAALKAKGYTVLGVVPDLKDVIRSEFGGKEYVNVNGQTISTGLTSVLNPVSHISEGYRLVRTNVDYSAPDSSHKIIMVTSSEPGEGKTSVAINLAIVNAQLGRKTLVIDGDMRRPRTHRMLGHQREPGLVNWLFDDGELNVESLKTGIDDLYLMPVGKAVPNPTELLGSVRMKNLVGRLKNHFDCIVIDSPPVLLVSDPMLMASFSDVLVLVASSGQTNWAALARSKEVLEDIGIPITGVVLNRYDGRSSTYSAYGYGKGYGYGYGYGSGYGSTYADQEIESVIKA
jgi:tyrosine-protein kinase Etk/Wzc